MKTGLRTLAVVCAFLIGFGGVWLVLANLPVWPLGRAGPPPPYLVMNFFLGAVAPLVVCLSAGTGLMLLARIDRRLEHLEGAKDR